MLARYEKFLKIFDKRLNEYFELHKEYIHCKKGCSECCEIGEYPFSRLEMEYIMQGFIKLAPDIKNQVKNNIKDLIEQKKQSSNNRFLYCCPFLLNKECSVYKYRGIICRTFGLAYVDKNRVMLPECANSGKNYSSLYNPAKKEIFINTPIKENLHIDSVLKSKEVEQFELESGIIKPLIEWF